MLVIYIQRFQRADWLRTRQLIPYSAEKLYRVQNVVIEFSKLALNCMFIINK